MKSKLFWIFKKGIYLLAGIVMTLIPICSLACFIYSCWSCIKYGNIDFIEIILAILNLCGFIIFTWLNCSYFFEESLKKYSKIEKLLGNIFTYSGLVCAIYFSLDL